MLDLNLRFDQPDLPTDGDYRRHLLARITPPEQEPSDDAPPLDLALVLDASGSMHGEPIDAAKQAAAMLADELDPSTRLTLVSFADDVVIHADRVPLDEGGRAVASVHCRGTTDLHGGWRTGCTLLADVEDDLSARQRQVVVLSDGCANRGVVEPEQLALEARRKVRRVPHGQRLAARATAHLADDHGPGVDADAHADRLRRVARGRLRAPAVDLSEEEIEQLQALGYAGERP